MARNQTDTSVPGTGFVRDAIARIAARWKEFRRPPETHSEKVGDGITRWESEVMLQQFEDAGVMWCPDCGEAWLRTGPQGGEATNVQCPMCLCEFSIYRIYLNKREVWGKREKDRKLPAPPTAGTKTTDARSVARLALRSEFCFIRPGSSRPSRGSG